MKANNEKIKLSNILLLPSVVTTETLSFLLSNAMIKKLMIGNIGMNLKSDSMCIQKAFYHLSLLRTSVSLVPAFLYIIMSMANPTATSAAATAIMKNTNTCAWLSPK